MKKKITVCGTLLLACALLLGGCGTKAAKTIAIATKPMTEQFILGEMLKQLIEAKTDIKVEVTKGVGGGTSNIQPALLKGDFDLYPEYTGTAWNFVLKQNEIPDDDTLYSQLKADYQKDYNLTWVGLYGFNNTYTLTMRQEQADKLGVTKMSQLGAVSNQLVFGGNADFYERDDGYDGLCAAYGLHFKKTLDIDIGLKYQAMKDKKIDVMTSYTTDGLLDVSNLKVLEDDQSYFKNYYCGTVVRDDTLKKYPELEPVLAQMNGLISNEEMSHMNYLVEEEKKPEQEVAKDFLVEKGLLKTNE